MPYFAVPAPLDVAGSTVSVNPPSILIGNGSTMNPVPTLQPHLGTLIPVPYVYTLITERKTEGFAG